MQRTKVYRPLPFKALMTKSDTVLRSQYFNLIQAGKPIYRDLNDVLAIRFTTRYNPHNATWITTNTGYNKCSDEHLRELTMIFVRHEIPIPARIKSNILERIPLDYKYMLQARAKARRAKQPAPTPPLKKIADQDKAKPTEQPCQNELIVSVKESGADGLITYNTVTVNNKPLVRRHRNTDVRLLLRGQYLAVHGILDGTDAPAWRVYDTNLVSRPVTPTDSPDVVIQDISSSGDIARLIVDQRNSIILEYNRAKKDFFTIEKQK